MRDLYQLIGPYVRLSNNIFYVTLKVNYPSYLVTKSIRTIYPCFNVKLNNPRRWRFGTLPKLFPLH